MKILPDIERKAIKRPGNFNGKMKHYIPDMNSHSRFWKEFYATISDAEELVAPIDNFAEKVNPYFGHFGFRWHPINFTPKYFHIGIDVTERIGTEIFTVAKGHLEYSGYADINGNYVMVSHPEIKTSDGFILQSTYMHCKKNLVNFNLTQKILREFISSKMSISNIKIGKDTAIALLGDTGNKLGVVPHLHLQFEFANKAGKRIAVNPFKLYGIEAKNNLTASLETTNEFSLFYQKHSGDLNKWSKFWINKLTL